MTVLHRVPHQADRLAKPGVEPPVGPVGDVQDSTASVEDPADRALRCAACDHPITQHAYRTMMSGAHAHTFVNPAGIVHTIGCFVAAPGCAHIGPTETAFSWFPGWAWQVAICTRCRTHLGWIFRLAPEQFHGLILAALRG